jgi:hypothetical protein
MAKIRRGKKQAQIAQVILQAADSGEYLTVSQIWDALPYKCAYGTLRKMLKVFEDRKMIEKERTGMSVTVKPMLLLYQWYRT